MLTERRVYFQGKMRLWILDFWINVGLNSDFRTFLFVSSNGRLKRETSRVEIVCSDSLPKFQPKARSRNCILSFSMGLRGSNS